MIKRVKYEKYKIFEYSNYSELALVKDSHTHTFFFFCGIQENASKYIHQFKSFFEKLENCNVKIIIPYPPVYNSQAKELSRFPDFFRQKFSSISTWFYRVKNDNKNLENENVLNTDNKEPSSFTYYTNNENHSSILALVSKEIKEIGSDKIILCGFSQGGAYLLRFILSVLKINTCFNIYFKSPLNLYINENKNNDLYYLLNSNKHHMFYSRYDKLCTFNTGIESYQNMCKEFDKSNVFIKYDNSNDHTVNNNCLAYLQELIYSYLKEEELTKF